MSAFDRNASESVVLQRHLDDLEAQGVLFADMHAAQIDHPEIVDSYFGKTFPPYDDEVSTHRSSVWSGGSFIYVPPGIEVALPLQAHSRVDASYRGQYERTLIIADEGAKVHYLDGCSAPVYSADSLRAAVVDIVIRPGAHVTYTTVQNWSSNVLNLVAKRAYVEAEGHMTWIDGNIGSRLTTANPTVWLAGPKATSEVRSVVLAGPAQHQHTGVTMVHLAPETASTIVSKSIASGGGRSRHRPRVRIAEGAEGCTSDVRCDALVLDGDSIADTDPDLAIGEPDAQVGFEASVATVSSEQLFYLESRGLSSGEATGMVVNGFIEPVTRGLPMEYAVEWSRLIELQVDGTLG